MISIFLNCRLLILRAGAKGVNIFLQASLRDWFTCKDLVVPSPTSYSAELFIIRQLLCKGLSTKKLHRSKIVAFPKLRKTFWHVPELWRCSQSTLRLRWEDVPLQNKVSASDALQADQRPDQGTRLPAAQLTLPVSGRDPERGMQTATVAQLFQLSRIDLTSN